MEPAEDSEWEYEYSPTETSTFYLTLDLSALPPTSPRPTATDTFAYPKYVGGRRSVLLHNRLRVPGSRTAPPLPTHNSLKHPSSSTHAASSLPEHDEPIQITGLHTSNPLILYQGRLLSCQWAQVVGTEMLFVRPSAAEGLTKEEGYEPLRELDRDLHLLGISATKLVAKEARLRPKDEVFGLGAEVPSEDTKRPVREEDGGSTSTPDFLARLNAAKRKRGERSQVVVYRTADGEAEVEVDHEESSEDEEEPPQQQPPSNSARVSVWKTVNGPDRLDDGAVGDDEADGSEIDEDEPAEVD